MLDSFRKLLGYSLLHEEEATSRAQDLFALEAVVLAHGSEEDPIFCYGNQAALELFEVDLPTLLGMPSRKSAEAVERSERASMLHRGMENGYIADYEGIRISSTGRRFLVRNAIIWNVFDEEDNRIGQAATFRDWEYL